MLICTFNMHLAKYAYLHIQQLFNFSMEIQFEPATEPAIKTSIKFNILASADLFDPLHEGDGRISRAHGCRQLHCHCWRQGGHYRPLNCTSFPPSRWLPQRLPAAVLVTVGLFSEKLTVSARPCSLGRFFARLLHHNLPWGPTPHCHCRHHLLIFGFVVTSLGPAKFF